MKPKKRSSLRIKLGKLYYTSRRYITWYLGSKKYALNRQDSLLPYTVFNHKTPLLRKLKDVDMQLQHNKIINLKIAISKLNGVIINPGETFSYWRLIGKPAAKKGYKNGMVLFYGGFKAGVGGGLCQLSNLIYWMTLHTPLTVTERHRHSYDVFPDSNRTQPFGSGATCSYNYMDLQILNETTQPYQLHLYMDKENLSGEWRCVSDPLVRYNIYEEKHWINHEIWGGYTRHNIICRKTFDINDLLIADECVAENHAIMMYQPFLSEGNK